MNSLIARLSIKRKLTLVTMATSAAALVVAAVMFGVYDDTMTRRAIVHDLETMADVVGGNSTAALAFDDAASASAILGRLRADPTIVRAIVRDSAGRAFSEYGHDNSGRPMACGSETQPVYAAGLLIVTRAITLNGDRIGTICVESDLAGVAVRHRAYFTIMLGVLAFAMLAAYLLSGQLQRLISGPILNLAQTARIVSTTQTYSSRAEKRTDDETGRLVDDFNGMLAQIEAQDSQLRQEGVRLEEQVNVRTHELVLRQGNGGSGEPLEERVPRQHVARNPDADERRHRHDRAGARHRPPAGSARVPQHGERVRRVADADHQRHPRLLENRSRQADARRRGVQPAQAAGRHDQAAGGPRGSEGARAAAAGRPAAAGSSSRRSGAAAAGARQSDRQRHQVHREGRGGDQRVMR